MAETIRKPIPTYLTAEVGKGNPFTISPQTNDEIQASTSSLSATRSWSSLSSRDSKVPSLSPAPAFLDTSKASKDDSDVSGMPVTPKRPGASARGLSLQLSMPPRDISSTSIANLSTNLTAPRVPLSPKLDSSPSYSSTGSVLPRRSRGLDFTRACTSLHHSTLAEQSSPDSSPVIGGGRGMNIPRRSQSNMAGPDSPMFPGSMWSSNGNSEKAAVSSSLGSINMMDSGSDSESSDDDLMQDEDTVHMTPHVQKQKVAINNPFNNSTGISSPSVETRSPFSQAAANLLSFQRRTRRGRSTRHSSSSASGKSTMPSPAPGSPPVLKSIESNGYFSTEQEGSMENRRQSLSLGTNALNISDSIESEDIPSRTGGVNALGIPVSASNTMDERRNVIRRAVTRRSNMMPKTRGFARIRAALQEEASPVDAESKRESEVIKQVRESDHSPDSTAPVSQPTTTASSPYLMPATTTTDALDDLTEMMSGETPTERRPSATFGASFPRTAMGLDFGTFETRVHTPPPPQFLGRNNSSGLSEDMNMDTPASYSMGPRYVENGLNSSPSRSSTPVPTANEMTRRTLGKRRRDDDLDPNLFKRRAVSPGLSLQNSPVLPPSPMRGDSGWWSTKSNRENSQGNSQGHAAGERVNSNGSTSGSGPIGKRVGLQGMTDTNDGMMNMSIE